MTPLPSAARSARRMSIVAGTLLAATTFASPAEAAFTTGKCQGDAITGRGASFAASAHTQAFIPAFGSVFCADVGGGPAVSYESLGSGAGRQVMGARTNVSGIGDNSAGAIARGFVPRFGMTDEPVAPADQANMNKGSDAVGDEGLVRTLPLAIGGVAIVVNLPDGCSIAAQPDGTALTVGQQGQLSDPGTANTRRLQITRDQLEKIFNGGTEIDTWGELVSWINDGDSTAAEPADTRCTSFPLVRIRRLDDSGTTFALKDYLGQVNPGRGWLTTFNTPNTTTWPNDTREVAFDYNNDGDTADAVPFCAANFATQGNAVTCTELDVPLLQTTEVLPSAGNGNDDLVNKVNDFDGSIGYGDLSTARQQRSFAFERQANATDDKYWVKLQAKNLTSYVDPQSAPLGFVAGGARGSSCNTAQLRNLPTGDDPTLGNWAQTSMVDSSPTAYGICTPTYALAWDDYATPYATQPGFNSATEERKAKTARDYLEHAVTTGQNGIGAFDYAALSPSVQALTLAAIQKIGFAKTSGGGGGTPPPPAATPTPTPAPGLPAPGATPPPVVTVPSNAFTTGKPKSSKGNATLTIQVPGAGTVTVVATSIVGKKKKVQIASAASSPTASGPVAITIKPSKAAAKELKKKKKLTVTLTITFTPTGGQPKVSTATVTIKAVAAKKKK